MTVIVIAVKGAVCC